MRDKRSLNLKSPQNSKRKKLGTGPAPALVTTLRLKIQRLRGEDFFICVCKRDLITKLKQQVLSFLISDALPGICIEITNIRLIYKGKVLADEKSIEFYHIQNEDTIQLVPFRRPRSTTYRATETKTEETSNRQERPVPNYITTSHEPVAFISFTPIIEEPSGFGHRRTFVSRDEHRRNVNWVQRFRSLASRRHQMRGTSPSSLRRFQHVLRTTNLRVMAEQQRRREGRRNGRRPLLLQLQTLICRASSLRDELTAESQFQPTSPEHPATTFQATSENGVFSIVSEQERTQNQSGLVAPVPTTGDEKRQSHPEEEKDYTPSLGALRNPQMQPYPSIFMQRNAGINIPVNHTSPIRHNFHQNRVSPRYQRFHNLSPRTTFDSPENQQSETFRPVFARLGISRSTSISNGEPGAATANALSIGLGEEHLQLPANTTNMSRRHTTASEQVNRRSTSNETSGEANQGTTIGGRLRNIFVQFLSGFLN